MSGLVSIITPTYNCGAYIAGAIQCVINQTYKDWEMIIVDDASTDNTQAIVAEFAQTDDRIKYIHKEKNTGAASSRNRALREARGRWVAFLDSDDLWEPEKLEHQVKFMLQHNYAFTYTKYQEMDMKGNLRGLEVSGPKHVTKLGMYIYCWPGCLTVMYDRERIGLIQIEEISNREDYAYWLKVVRKADCYLLPEVLSCYRKRTGSNSNHSYAELIMWQYNMFVNGDHRNPVLALMLTAINTVCAVIKKVVFVKRTKTK